MAIGRDDHSPERHRIPSNDQMGKVYNNIVEFDLYDGDMKVKIEITEEKKNAIVARILDYIKTYNCTSGEKLHQDDDCIMYAPEVLSDIIDDILNIEKEWVDE